MEDRPPTQTTQPSTPQVPTPPGPTPTPMDSLPKTSPPPRHIPKVALILIALIIIAVITLGGLMTFKNMNTNNVVTVPSPIPDKPSANPDPTNINTWKTYKHNDGTFSFKYPSHMNISSGGSPYENLLVASEYKEPFSEYFNFVLQRIILMDTNINLKSWINTYVIQELPDGKKGSIVQGEIKSYSNNQIEGYTFIGGTESIDKHVIFKKNNYVYTINLRGSGTGSSYTQNPDAEKLLDQILSTFKFLGEIKEGWEVFSHSYENYSFQYPSSWRVVKAATTTLYSWSDNRDSTFGRTLPSSVIQIEFYVLDNPKLLTVEQWALEYPNETSKLLSEEKITVDDKTAMKRLWSGDGRTYFTVELVEKDKLYRILGAPGNSQYLNEFNEIIKLFKTPRSDK